MATIKEIPYRNLPNQSELFLRYLELSPDALSFYPCIPTLENLDAELCNRTAGRSLQRSNIVSVLRRQNKRYGCGADTLGNIDALEHPECVAIVTGQQVGFFTGPLYTIYKALTAVRLVEALQAKGVQAVPLFWMETEDHDLVEVTRQTILIHTGGAQAVDYRELLFGNTSASIRPVGSIRLPETIREVVRHFSDSLPDSDWKTDTVSLLNDSYTPGATFTEAFATLLLRILRGCGLILFDPQDPQIKPLIAPVFQWALEDANQIHSLIGRRNRELKKNGFQPQVNLPDNSTLLFYIEKGERRALEKRGNGFGLRNSERDFSHQSLLDCVQSNPERFSPNVLLRPIVQDTLFPTLAYVGGPAEVAYFAQTQLLYDLRKLPMPVIWPRASFTLMESGVRKTMQHLGLEVQDCFDGIQLLRGKIIKNTEPRKPNTGLHKLQKNIEKAFKEIRRSAGALDPSLPQAMDTAQRKMLHNIGRLHSRLLHIEKSIDTSVLDTVGLLLNHCLPNRNLQERELSILYFLSCYGPTILDTIRSAIRIPDYAHRVLHLE